MTANDGTTPEFLENDNDRDIQVEGDLQRNRSIAGDESGVGKSQGFIEMINVLSKHLCSVQEDGEELAAGFQRIPNRRILPDYFDIIDEPIAFSTIRGKIQKKLYTSFSEFVKDVAQICHNAQVYNRPSAPIFGAAERLRDVFKDELQKLVANGQISPQDSIIPDLGELPPAEDSPSMGSEAEVAGEDEERRENIAEQADGDDNDESDESEEEQDHGVGSSRHKLSVSGAPGREDDDDEDSPKKRGRPPMIMTPLEARISSILKGLRRVKDHGGNFLISAFEKLPDKSVIPGYYQAVTNPIALDCIKKKAKRKKYKTITEVMADIEMMFQNAMSYNENDSDLYRAAVELQRQARILAAREIEKPDDDFRDEDGKLALAEVQAHGDTWRVGDWVHIRNPNDLAKPIVAQIFRIWQDRAEQQWINACWYYRPEQTIHRFDKHFFEHEVVKTGQYRDHHVGEVIDRCFVMFVTRFNKGRPRGFPSDKDVYVCESRYNEDHFRFNKIKTWASCLPDEVREQDYEMDLFEVPCRMKKVPSPIKHLLREDAKDSSILPKATWGSPNAPPIVGAVHCQPPQPNESPPPEPTPPPAAPIVPELPPESVYRASVLSGSRDSMSDASTRGRALFSATGPAALPTQYHAHMASFQPLTPMSGGTLVHQTPVPIPHPPHQASQPQVPIRPMQYQYPRQQPGYPHNFTPHYVQPSSMPTNHQPVANSRAVNYTQPHLASTARPPSVLTPGGPQSHSSFYNPPRPSQVFILPENANDALPAEIQRNFQHDATGKVLFFATAPLERISQDCSSLTAGLGHSIKFLAGREAWLTERDQKRKKRNDSLQLSAQRSNFSDGTSHRSFHDAVTSRAEQAVEDWFRRFDEETRRWEQDAGLDDRKGFGKKRRST